MSEYIPDKWVVIKIIHTTETLYKVLGSWSGGYAQGDSWRMNSGIVQSTKEDGTTTFYGASGSNYVCNDFGYGVNGLSSDVLDRLLKQAEESNTFDIKVMNHDTDWSSIDWEIS